MRAASAVTPIASAGFSLPPADSAPAANSHGADGSGKPACSAKTIANKTGPPWPIRNCVMSFMRCFVSGASLLDWLSGWLVVPRKPVEHAQHNGGDYKHEHHCGSFPS